MTRDPRVRVVAACEGKKTFTSFRLAERAAERADRNKDARLRPYHCPHCRQFHVGEVGHRRARELRIIGVEDER